MRSYLFLLTFIVCSGFIVKDLYKPWGFFGHRKINRMAVYTLPLDMLVFYKPNLEYITEHAVDPDKRRYVSSFEAVRHYIDLDHWGDFPFDNVPRSHSNAVLKFGEIFAVKNLDTILIHLPDKGHEILSEKTSQITLCKNDFENLFNWLSANFFPGYYERTWHLKGQELISTFSCTSSLNSFDKVVINDEFSEFGIVPYHINRSYYNLIKAFKELDTKRILRLSAEIGHYISDASVPLHTTENYNGQLTNQIGIHAFWESRIPELFADEEYDYLVGHPEFIEHPREYFWNIVLESHSLLDSVLLIEKRIRMEYPKDQQYCYEDRLERLVRIECNEFAKYYQTEMKGMVEQRMRDAIHYVSSTWYSAWVAGGQPNLKYLLDNINWSIEELKEMEEQESEFLKGKPLGRPHANGND